MKLLAAAALLIAGIAQAHPKGKIDLHRAWLLRGGSGVEPSAGAEVIAIDFTHRDMKHVHAKVTDLQGNVFDSYYNWVRLDHRGNPIDRTGSLDASGSVRVAMVSAVPKGTREVLLAIEGLDAFRVRIAESGPKWPPMPEYTVLKWSKNLAGTGVFALVRVQHALAGEPRSPLFQERVKEGNIVAVQQRATSVVSADQHGEPLPQGNGDLYVAYYPWQKRLPTEYNCKTGWCPLGKPSKWVMSEALFDALSGRASEPKKRDLR